MGLASTSSEDLSWSVARVTSTESFANRGLYVDTPVVVVCSLLLLLTLALFAQRIFGLDAYVARLMLGQQEQRSQNNTEAREKLERSWDEEQP